MKSSQIHEPTAETKYKIRRREDMHTRVKQYGFFKVATEPTPIDQCSGCLKTLNGVNWVRINGSPICGECLDARN